MAQIQEEIQLAWNAVQVDGITKGWDNETKSNALQTELKKEDNSATATLTDPNIKVTYKGYETTINVNDGSMTQLAKAENSPNQTPANPSEPTSNSSISTKILAVNSKTTLQTISYTPTETETSVIIPSTNNGGASQQTITQTSIGALNRIWYVLSADENGINLVSQPISNTVIFKDAGGYDNCLYYLNEIATKLFTNESVGITASRVHALRLSDIKYVAEEMNGNNWIFDTEVLETANKHGTFGTEIQVNSYRKYPQIYGTSITDTIQPNNAIYDETTQESGIPISGDLIKSTSSTANTLKLNDTSSSYDKSVTFKTNLGTFGTTEIAQELFNSSGTSYWIATRSISATESTAMYGLRRVYNGYLMTSTLASSANEANPPSASCRIVVSVPWTLVSVTTDGTVTLN